jgi:hypothetical protein
LYEAAKPLGLSLNTVTLVAFLSLLATIETLVRTKESASEVDQRVTISGYSLGHRLLKEIAEELRTKRTYDSDNASLDSLELLSRYTLGRDWASRFILRHLYVTVTIRRRIEFVRMDEATKPVLDAWFDTYQKVVQKQRTKYENRYNMDESGSSIRTIEIT